jgi:hypothetical protein
MYRVRQLGLAILKTACSDPACRRLDLAQTSTRIHLDLDNIYCRQAKAFGVGWLKCALSRGSQKIRFLMGLIEEHDVRGEGRLRDRKSLRGSC